MAVGLNLCIRAFIFLCLFVPQLWSVPLIQKIVNTSDIGFVIVKHTDPSGCSLSNRGVLVDAQTVFSHEFLLELGKPSVILRPMYYLDPQSKQKITFVDQNYQIIPDKLAQAYDLWKSVKGHKKFVTPQAWLTDWIGLDISVVPHEVEIFGYLINLSRVIIKNNRRQQARWLSFAKGIFSKLVVELQIDQHSRKGILTNMKILHGEGGVCTDNGSGWFVERL